MGKRQDAALETRQKIVDTMRLLLQEKAADRIGIEEITERAGVAKGTFYTYFKRKEDVISVIAMDCYNIIRDTVFQPGGDVYEQLCSYLRSSAKVIEKYTLQIAQNWLKSVVAPLQDEQGGMEKYRFDYENIKQMLAAGIQAGRLQASTPIEMLTQSIMNSYYGAVLSWCMTKGEAGLTESIENYCAHALKLLIGFYQTKA